MIHIYLYFYVCVCVCTLSIKHCSTARSRALYALIHQTHCKIKCFAVNRKYTIFSQWDRTCKTAGMVLYMSVFIRAVPKCISALRLGLADPFLIICVLWTRKVPITFCQPSSQPDYRLGWGLTKRRMIWYFQLKDMAVQCKLKRQPENENNNDIIMII